MSSRYYGRKTKTTNQEMYQDLLDDRGVKKVDHYATPQLNHPTKKQREDFTKHIHVWKVGDRFYKLAHRYYGDSKYWWVIAHWNLRPTDSHVTFGEGIRIPGPLNVVVGILKQGAS
tara:strand:- start:287 stop:634 length:348 start_codon:yes stop_codon:yes gene_type:complete